jgi:hypothetical protein
MKPHFGGPAGRLYSDQKQQPVMFSSSSCNFFMPFAQKDARFAASTNGRRPRCRVLKKYPGK